MKLIYTIICALTCSFYVSAQSDIKSSTVLNAKTQTDQNKGVKQTDPAGLGTSQNAVAKDDVISLKENEFNFEKIPQGKPVTHDFFFTNTGKTPLSLQNVQASCGCTTPEWSKDAVAPGATSKITVGYNAANIGAFTKSITITYNDTESKQLLIKGEVWQTPAAPAPENSTLETLKNQQ